MVLVARATLRVLYLRWLPPFLLYRCGIDTETLHVPKLNLNPKP